jgi:hypothetical protein
VEKGRNIKMEMLVVILFVIAFIGWLMVPIMKALGYLLLIGSAIFAALTIGIVANAPGIAIIVLILMIIATRDKRKNRCPLL